MHLISEKFNTDVLVYLAFIHVFTLQLDVSININELR